MRKGQLAVWVVVLLATIGVGYLLGSHFSHKSSKVDINELPPNTAWQEVFPKVSGLNQWRTENYNNPLVQVNGTRLVIAGEGKPAGLFFRKLLDRKQKYQVDITGNSLSGSVNLRVRLDDREPYWVGAPSGDANFIVRDIERVELLIYSDSQFSYELSKLVLTPVQN